MTEQTKQPFLPIIIGTDLNAYTMACSFYDRYGIKPVLIGKLHMFFTMDSSVMETIHYDKNLTDPDRFVETMKILAKHYSKLYDQLLLIGTNDIYINLMIDHQEELAEDYVFNIPTKEVRDLLFYKKSFYEYCQKNGIDTPKTLFYDCSNPTELAVDFTYPLVVKPSDVVAYQMAGLATENKLHFIQDEAHLHRVVQEVIDGGYKSDLIIQEFIPGDDSYMWDAVYYANQKGDAQLITLAQVILQERKPHLVGAYTALMTRYNEAFMQKLVDFLEEANYTGFANFDIKYDYRDGKFKVFEVNIRQGRSSSYIDSDGHHLAEYLVDDIIHNKKKDLHFFKEKLLYSVVPAFVLLYAIKDSSLKEEIKKRLKNKQFVNPLHSDKDSYNKHWLYMLKRKFNYAKTYR